MIALRGLATVAVVAIVLSACAGAGAGAPSTEPAMPDGLDREPDAVGMLSAAWIAGSGGPVEITPDSATWGLASTDDAWDGAELGIRRVEGLGGDNVAATVFVDGDGNETADRSADLWEGQHVRVWCDMQADSLPPMCSVSHLQLSHSLEG